MINTVIDISHWQKIYDFEKIKNAGVIGIIHKATDGLSYYDAKFDGRREFIDNDEKLLFGSYHFLQRNGYAEAERYIDKVKPTDNELIMLDTESQQLSNRNNILESEKFVKRVHELTGRYPVWYINNFMLNQYTQIGSYEGMELLNCPLFVARYSSKQPNIPAPFKTWTLWQYTQDGVVDGISTVDRDYFNGDLQQFLKFWNVDPERAKAFEGINVSEGIADNDL